MFPQKTSQISNQKKLKIRIIKRFEVTNNREHHNLETTKKNAPHNFL